MKKLLFLALFATIMAGCDKKNPDGTYEPCRYKVYVIDSCEYVGICESSQTDYLAHKGNCSFCKERNEQLLRKVVHEEVDSILIDIFD